MGCTQIHFDVPVVDNLSVPIDEPKTVVLTKTTAVHIINQDPCAAPLDICVTRIVKCQSGCRIDRIAHDYPIDSCDPILPPGEYEITIPRKEVLQESGTFSVDVIFEDVTAEYVQALIANKSGGC